MRPSRLATRLRSPHGRRFFAVWLIALALGLGAYAWLRGVEERAARTHLADRSRAAVLAMRSYFGSLEARLRWVAEADGGASPELAPLLGGAPPLAELLLLGAEGQVLDAAGPAPLLAEQFSRPQASWNLAVRRGRPYLGLLRESTEAEAGFVLALPAAGGRAAIARAEAAALWQAFDAQAPAGGRLLLVDGEGRLLARSGRYEASLLGLRPIEEPGLDQALAGGGAWWGRIRRPDQTEALAQAEALPAAWPSDPATNPERWWVYIEAPAAALLPASRLLGLVLLSGLALLALALAAAALTSPAGAAEGSEGATEALLPSAASGSPPLNTSPSREAGSGTSERLPGGFSIERFSRQDLDQVLRRLDGMVDRAKEVDRLKSEFLATISHELRTPLNSVIGYAELILSGINGPVDDETRQDVRAIHENGLLLLRIVNDLLDLAKIEADRLELELSQLDPAALVQAAVEQWSQAAKNKGLTLTWNSEADLPLIWGDGGRLNQVLSNLLSNAIKFTDRGGITVVVTAAGKEVAIQVTDTGPGIATEDRETIFERFRQLDGSLTRRAGGTGLGLAISRHLVRMHGGRIEVSSEAGRGATFAVILPVEEQPSHLRGRRVGPLLW